ncbi:hypothetical protein C943_01738 [Mariniradius saccharolyticus AK6]|uniref:Uncharacterized protein n=1 Tax=Mariniradius saccharolyticus AK6 TaxID=1239962 RepID=M7XBM2_9BACT|nr:hypothetical protein C943_01738 [Mariniradius saccharolyticus AK6]
MSDTIPATCAESATDNMSTLTKGIADWVPASNMVPLTEYSWEKALETDPANNKKIKIYFIGLVLFS